MELRSPKECFWGCLYHAPFSLARANGTTVHGTDGLLTSKPSVYWRNKWTFGLSFICLIYLILLLLKVSDKHFAYRTFQSSLNIFTRNKFLQMLFYEGPVLLTFGPAFPSCSWERWGRFWILPSALEDAHHALCLHQHWGSSGKTAFIYIGLQHPICWGRVAWRETQRLACLWCFCCGKSVLLSYVPKPTKIYKCGRVRGKHKLLGFCWNMMQLHIAICLVLDFKSTHFLSECS